MVLRIVVARPRRRLAATALALGVLGVHLGWIWRSVPAPLPAAGRGAAAPVLQVRQLPAPVVELARAPAPRTPAPRAMAAPADARAAGRPGPEPIEAVTEAPVSAEDWPVYSTKLAPAFVWKYAIQQGQRSGRAELAWAPTAEAGYEARLQAQLGERPWLDWRSRGTLDGAGVAPDRFVVRRRGRDAVAANFQRAAGKISYSGPALEHPLPPGAQDRLSWLLQLAGVVDADPARFGPGARISLFVTGVGGDADAWHFQVLGSDMLDGAGGAPRPALVLLRQPTRLYETRAEVWLDPARHHLPLRLRLVQGRGEPIELVLDDGP